LFRFAILLSTANSFSRTGCLLAVPWTLSFLKKHSVEDSCPSNDNQNKILGRTETRSRTIVGLHCSNRTRTAFLNILLYPKRQSFCHFALPVSIKSQDN